jgi:hypothetical protein
MAIQRPLYNPQSFLSGLVGLVFSWPTTVATNVQVAAANIKGGFAAIEKIQKGLAGIYTVTFRDAPVDDYGFVASLQVPAGGPYRRAVAGPRSQANRTLLIYTVAPDGSALADPADDANSRITVSVSFKNSTLPA